MKTEDSKKELMEQTWNNMMLTLADNLDKHTIPIYFNDEGLLRDHGTGVLIKHENSYFLVSAAHVLEIDTSDYISIPINKTTIIGLNKVAKLTPHIEKLYDRRKDKIDVAVVKLYDEKTIEQLKLSKAFLSIKSITKNHKSDSQLYNHIVFGYPNSGVDIKYRKGYTEIESEILVYPTNISSFKKFEKYRCDPANNILLDYKTTMKRYNSGQIEKTKDPNGISGCGLWYYDIEHLKKHGEIKYCLVGIIIEFQKNYQRVLIATKMHWVTNLIENFDEIEKKMVTEHNKR